MEESESEENALVSHKRSLHAIIETPVRFVNRTGRQVNIKWINYSGEEVFQATIMSNNRQDVNTFMTHPWIAVDSETNERMLLNFSETYLPGEPEVRRMDYQLRRAYVVRAQVIITLPVYKLEEYCVKVLRNIVSPQEIDKLPLPSLILEKISRIAS